MQRVLFKNQDKNEILAPQRPNCSILDLGHCKLEGIVLKLTLPILIANTDSRECNRGAESYVVASSNFVLKIVD